MKSHQLSHSQRLTLLWLGAVSPLFQRLPGALMDAGGAVWLAPVFALFPLGLTALLFYRLLSALPGTGLSEGLCRVLGPGAGRCAGLVYALWAFVLCAGALRSGAERFRWAVFPQSDATPFLLVMAGLGLMGALGRLRTLGRMGEVVLPFLLLGLGLVLLPGLGSVEWKNLRIEDPEAVPAAALGALTVTNTLSGALFAAFLPAEGAGGKKHWLYALWALGGLGLAVCVATVGRLGPALSGELPYPFFVMLRDVRLPGLLERAEALICAQWVVTDFLLTATLLSAGGRCAAVALTGQSEPRVWMTAAGAGMALAAAWFAPEVLWAAVPVGNAVLLFGGLAVVFCIGRLRRAI